MKSPVDPHVRESRYPARHFNYDMLSGMSSPFCENDLYETDAMKSKKRVRTKTYCGLYHVPGFYSDSCLAGTKNCRLRALG